MLKAEELLRVEDAIREAERGTSGEIVVVVARRASRYRSVPWAYGLAGGLLTTWLVLATGRLSPLVASLVPLLVASGIVAALGVLPLRLALTPRFVRQARAREAAEREFASHGMANTRGRTGILLFVAEAERYAEVIGDVTIGTQVPETEWREIIADLVGAFGRGAAADGLVRAIGRMGDVLRRHAPAGSGDTDELPNRVVLL